VASTPATITIGSATIIADPSSGSIIASQTLTPGGQIIHPLQPTLSPQKTLVWWEAPAHKSSLPPLLQHHPYLLTK
jgi:hypothetical protein